MNAAISGPIIEVIDPSTDTAYGEWIARARNSSIFHSAQWAKLLQESYRYRPRYFVLKRAGEIKACLPVMEVDSFITGRRGVSLSFSDCCEAVVSDEIEFKLLLENVLAYGRLRRWRYAEFRGESHLLGETPSQAFVQHNLSLLPNESTMQSKFRKSVVRNIQKAVKEGVRVEMRYDVGGIISFYQLHCLTRKRQGLPPQAKKYFVNLHRCLIAQGLGYTALAYHGPTVVAGLVCLRFGKNAIYKYGASDEKYQSLRANNLLFWEMIRKCSEEGCEILSLGRTDVNNDGLMLFKDGWGGQRSDLRYYRFDFEEGGFVNHGGGPSGYEPTLKRLPISLLRLLGYLGYPHMG